MMIAYHKQRPLAAALIASLVMVAPTLAQSSAERQPVATDLPTTPDIDAQPKIDSALALEIAQMIALFSTQSYDDRERGSDRLREIGPPAFALLRTAFFNTSDLEVKLRIEAVVRETYLDKLVYSRNGFLGISQDRTPKLPADYPQIPHGHVGIRIARVHVNTAAERAGLAAKDILIAINGEFIEESDNAANQFGQLIRQHGPDEEVILSTIRDQELHEFPVILGRCPVAMVKLGQIQAVTTQLDAARRDFREWWKRNFRDPNQQDLPEGSRNKPAS